MGSMGLRSLSSTIAPGRAALACVCALVAVLAGAMPAQGAEGGCANEARRIEQDTTSLPDCRAYEKVSPADKGNGDIVADGGTVIAATGGGAVAFNSRTPFGDEVGTGDDGQTQYVARRNESGTGWTTHSVTPAPSPESFQTFFTATFLEIFSGDLRTALVWGYDLPGGGGEPHRRNIYAEDTATRALQPLTLSQDQPLQLLDFIEPKYVGISADAHHVAFETSTKLLPINELKEFTQNVYQSDNGVLKLAGILPDGSVPAGGSYATVGKNSIFGGGYRGAMSAAGSRLLFMGVPGENPQLYMRIDGERTAWVSEPENGESIEPVEVRLQYMTPDGDNVFFVTSSKLLSEDENEGPDLYRWTYGPDPEHEKNLTLITNTGALSVDQALESGVVGASDDGTKVYYRTKENVLSVWDDGATRTISEAAGADATNNSLTALATGPGLGRVSPNGMWLAFVLISTLGTDGIHGLTGQVTNGHYEMYVYGLRDDTLRCVSCPSGPATSDTFVAPELTHGDPQLVNIGIRPQFLSDGGKVFFSTAEALLPQDSNGVADVYEYDGETGKLGLLSPGTGSEATAFADASANGEDVFVQTRQQLLAEDQDSLVDMYDVRVDGGFPAPAPAPVGCVADECQSQPSPAPGFGAPATVGFSGAGNVRAAAGKPVIKALKARSNQRRLARALRACKRKRSRARRRKCEAQARKRYGKKMASARGSK
jgi:hypothetical protein